MAARRRSPRGARSLVRAMFVVGKVSSRNTRSDASSRGARSVQAARASAASARSCSAARNRFFERQAHVGQRAPHRTHARRHVALTQQPRPQLGERRVVRCAVRAGAAGGGRAAAGPRPRPSVRGAVAPWRRKTSSPRSAPPPRAPCRPRPAPRAPGPAGSPRTPASAATAPHPPHRTASGRHRRPTNRTSTPCRKPRPGSRPPETGLAAACSTRRARPGDRDCRLPMPLASTG